MQKLGRKSLAHEIQSLISFLLYLEMALAVITCLFFILAVSAGDEGDLMSAWPVRLYPAVENTYSPSVTDPGIIAASVKVNEGIVEFSSRETLYYLLKGIDIILMFAFIIYITYLLREIFKSLTYPHPFTVENAKRLRIIALLILLIIPYKICRSELYYIYIQHNISIKGGQWINWQGFFGLEAKENLLLMPEIDLQALLIGVLLLIITEVFRIGTALQADNDSII